MWPNSRNNVEKFVKFGDVENNTYFANRFVCMCENTNECYHEKKFVQIKNKLLHSILRNSNEKRANLEVPNTPDKRNHKETIRSNLAEASHKENREFSKERSPKKKSQKPKSSDSKQDKIKLESIRKNESKGSHSPKVTKNVKNVNFEIAEAENLEENELLFSDESSENDSSSEDDSGNSSDSSVNSQNLDHFRRERNIKMGTHVAGASRWGCLSPARVIIRGASAEPKIGIFSKTVK